MKGQEYNLKNLTKCPLCESRYENSQISMLDEAKGKTIFHLTCTKCQSAVIAFITEGKRGIVSLGLATDLNSREAEIMFKRNPIDKNEVLNVYKYLNNK